MPHPALPGACDCSIPQGRLASPSCPRASSGSLWQEQHRGHRAWGQPCHRLPCGAGIHHPAAPDLFISWRFWCDNVPHLATRALSNHALSRCPGNVRCRCQCCHEEGGWALGAPSPFWGAAAARQRCGNCESPAVRAWSLKVPHAMGHPCAAGPPGSAGPGVGVCVCAASAGGAIISAVTHVLITENGLISLRLEAA